MSLNQILPFFLAAHAFLRIFPPYVCTRACDARGGIPVGLFPREGPRNKSQFLRILFQSVYFECESRHIQRPHFSTLFEEIMPLSVLYVEKFI